MLLAGLLVSALQLLPPDPRPGDPVRLRWSSVSSTVSEARAEAFGFAFVLPKAPDGGFEGWMALPIEAEPGPVEVRVQAGARSARGRLRVRRRKFSASQLRVAPKFTQPERPPELEARIEAERASIRRVWAREPSPVRRFEDFAAPLKGRLRRTGRYGARRVFNGTTQSRHYGLDLAGPVGRPVYATAPGRVVLVEDRFYSGRTVVIDHGGGLLSLYFHLSRTHVEVGTELQAGDRLGAVGKSGRVTGPHLHLSVAVRAEALEGGEVRGLYVEPEALLP